MPDNLFFFSLLGSFFVLVVSSYSKMYICEAAIKYIYLSNKLKLIYFEMCVIDCGD